MRVQISVSGVKEVQMSIGQLGKRVENLKPPLTEITKILNEAYQKNYPAKGSELEKPWPPRKRNYPWPILVKTGKMKSSYSTQIKRKEAEIWNATPYAIYHQFGTPKLPVRRILDITKNLIKKAEEIILNYILKK